MALPARISSVTLACRDIVSSAGRSVPEHLVFQCSNGVVLGLFREDAVRRRGSTTRSGWGYGFGFRDPEGNVWGVAVKYGSGLDDRGLFTYP